MNKRLIEQISSSNVHRSRYVAMDIARGIAALTVVLWHWQHFWYGPDGHPLNFVRSVQPLYGEFRIAYEFGSIGVDFFFMLSGFIFFWKYSNSIWSGRVDGWRFFVLRFSRLYPLHLVTLLSVALLQIVMYLWLEHAFVYSNTDLYHFVLNLFLASTWGLEEGWSFNGPSWSVSVEVLLYAAFFVLARIGLTRWWQIAALAVVGLVVKQVWVETIGRGIWCFFLGGLVLLSVLAVQKARVVRRVLVAALCLVGLSSIAVAWNLDGWLSQGLAVRLVHGIDMLARFSPTRVGELISAGTALFTYLLFTALLFPAILLVLALGEGVLGKGVARLAFLGDISYSTYLIHFPLQIVFVMLVALINRDYSPLPFQMPAMLALYIGFLTGLALLSYHYLEMPAQNFLRLHLLPKRRLAPT